MRRKILIVSKLLCLALLLLLPGAHAQDFQIRTRVDLVVVPVTVKASGDHLITGLRAGSLSTFQQTFPALAGAFSQFDDVSVYRYDKYVAKVLDFSQDLAVVETAMKTLKAIKPDTNLR